MTSLLLREYHIEFLLNMRFPLLKLGGNEGFASYAIEFHSLYQTREIVNVLGRIVRFRDSDCRHICYKTDEDNYNRGRKAAWSQERAERIPWILPTLQQPFEIRPNKVRNRQTYLLRTDSDVDQQLPQEYFCAIVEIDPKDTDAVWFVTAYPIGEWRQWKRIRDEGKKIYPKDNLK